MCSTALQGWCRLRQIFALRPRAAGTRRSIEDRRFSDLSVIICRLRFAFIQELAVLRDRGLSLMKAYYESEINFHAGHRRYSGVMKVEGDVVTVTTQDGRTKTREIGASKPGIVARILLIQLGRKASS